MAQRVIRGGAVVAEYKALANKTTTVNTYVDVEKWDTLSFKTKYFTFDATTNDLKVKVLGSVDGGTTFPFTVEAEFTVTVGTTTTKTVTTPYTHLKPQVKPAVNDTHGTLATRVLGANY